MITAFGVSIVLILVDCVNVGEIRGAYPMISDSYSSSDFVVCVLVFRSIEQSLMNMWQFFMHFRLVYLLSELKSDV